MEVKNNNKLMKKMKETKIIVGDNEEKVYANFNENVNVSVGKNAKLMLFNLGGSVKTTMNGEDSTAITKSLFVDDVEANVEIIHNAENTKSELITKSILFENSKEKINELIRINKNAKNSKGHQKKNVLLLGENIEINTSPNLEINNNEVECSHGCSIENIDEESLFYLMSRGLSEKESKKEIARAFVNSVVENLNEYIIADINKKIDIKLEELR